MRLYLHKCRFYAEITRKRRYAVSENFNKIKRKYKNIAIIAGCILGVCCGIALTCVIAVALKVSGVNFHFALYIPVAAALSAGAAFLFYLIIKPDDAFIAKKLDKEFNLGQKAQTMVEYAAVEGAMPALQREQTNEVLGEVAKKRVSLKWLLKFAFIPVIAAAMLFAGIFVPAKKSGYVDPPFDITNSQETALVNLITDVQKSDLEDGLKDSVVDVLDGLLTALKDAEQQSVMKKSVILAVASIDALVAAENSYIYIDNVFKADTSVSVMSTAVVDSVVYYKLGSTVSSYKAVESRVEQADVQMTAILNRWKKKFLADYGEALPDNGGLSYTPVYEAATKLYTFSVGFKRLLDDPRLKAYAPAQTEGGEEEIAALSETAGDALYAEYLTLYENFNTLYQSVFAGGNGGYTDKSFYEAIEGKIDLFIANLTMPTKPQPGAAYVQSYRCIMDEFIRNSLARIFNISRSELPNNAVVAPDPSDPQNPALGDNSDGGGFAIGDHKFGSDDLILDPNTGEKKPYGELRDPSDPTSSLYFDYFNRMLEYIKDDSLSDDDKAYIRRYFDLLGGNS